MQPGGEDAHTDLGYGFSRHAATVRVASLWQERATEPRTLKAPARDELQKGLRVSFGHALADSRGRGM